MTQPADSREDEILDELLKPKSLGGPIFVEKTMSAIRADARHRRANRLRAWMAGAGAMAASLLFVATLSKSPQTLDPALASAYGQNPELEAEAALYAEMLALESLLQPADVLAEEENQQTLNFLIALTSN